MSTLEDTLQRAAQRGIIPELAVQPLEAYLLANGSYTANGNGAAPEPDIVPEPSRDLEGSESPRFVRGFHDILITIGIIVVLVGLSGVGSVFAMVPAVLLLSEVLVRRQRLALPAFVLTIAFAQGVGYFVAAGLGEVAEGWNDVTYWCAFVVSYPVLLGLYYWRYRVPVALALTLFSLFALALLSVLMLLGRLMGSENFVAEHRIISASIFMVAAIGLFTVAMRYDLSDPQRLTRRSDIAFWLHLGAAPVLLYAMLFFVFLDRSSTNWWGVDTSYGHAAMVIAIVGIFMLIGLIIDRRAFVTSGLASLGFAIWTILRQNSVGSSEYAPVTILVVGIVVLGIGIFWQPLRRLVMGLLPAKFAGKLHAVH